MADTKNESAPGEQAQPVKLTGALAGLATALKERQTSGDVRAPVTSYVGPEDRWAMAATVCRLHPDLTVNLKAIRGNGNTVWQFGRKRPTPQQVACYTNGTLLFTNLIPVTLDQITDEDRKVGEALAAAINEALVAQVQES